LRNACRSYGTPSRAPASPYGATYATGNTYVNNNGSSSTLNMNNGNALNRPNVNYPVGFNGNQNGTYAGAKIVKKDGGNNHRSSTGVAMKAVNYTSAPSQQQQGQQVIRTTIAQPQGTTTTTTTTTSSQQQQQQQQQQTRNVVIMPAAQQGSVRVASTNPGVVQQPAPVAVAAAAAPAPAPVAVPVVAAEGSSTAAAVAAATADVVQPNPARKASAGGTKTGKEVDAALVQRVLGEVLDVDLGVKWDDIIGLDFAKQTLQETVILPHQRPELFKGIRAPPKGLLLFGPPGNGKTMIAKAIASEFNATFFCISAASLVSKMLGDSERLMRALFQAARERQPAIIFIDEIDSILSARSAQENDGIQRLKTEFFVQMDGVVSDAEEKVLVMGATNRPAAIDPAARRRLVKRIYVPLPDKEAREALITKSLKDVPTAISAEELSRIATRTDGYSGFDISSLCREAALGPIRELGAKIKDVKAEDVRPVSFRDFREAIRVIRPSVSADSLHYYEQWDKEFGSAVTPYVQSQDSENFGADIDL
jgi:ATP-dependent 26S proteasome regulatory subunit